jgi:hypothetical protein
MSSLQPLGPLQQLGGNGEWEAHPLKDIGSCVQKEIPTPDMTEADQDPWYVIVISKIAQLQEPFHRQGPAHLVQRRLV